MSALTILHGIRQRETNIELLRESIDQHLSQLTPQSPRYDSDRVQTSPTNRMESAIAYVSDDVDRLKRMKARQAKDKAYILGYIKRLDSRYQNVLILYYLTRLPSPYPGITDPLRWSDVAHRLGYSTSHCKRLHRAAVGALDKLLTNSIKP